MDFYSIFFQYNALFSSVHNQVVFICFALRKTSLICGISFFLIEIARRFRCHLLMYFRIQSKEAMVSFSIFSVTILSIYYYIFTKRSCGLFVNCSMGLPVISLPNIAVGAYGKYEIRVCVFSPTNFANFLHVKLQ